MKELHDKLAAHLHRCPGDPQEVLRAAREKVTFRSKLLSYGGRLLYRQDEREFRQPDARLQYGQQGNGGLLSSNPYYNHDDDDEQHSAGSDSDSSDGAADTSSRNAPPAGEVQRQQPTISDARATSRPPVLGRGLRGNSFTLGSKRNSADWSPGGGGGVMMSALSSTAAATQSVGTLSSGVSSSRNLKPTRPAPLRATASFTLGSNTSASAGSGGGSGGGGSSSTRPGTAAANWAHARAAAGGLPLGTPLTPHAPSAALPPQQRPPSSSSSSSSHLPHQHMMRRPQTSPDHSWLPDDFADAPAAAVKPLQPAAQQPAQPPQPTAPPRTASPPTAPPLPQRPASLTRALSLKLNRLASSVGINYMGLGRRTSEAQEAAAAELADALQKHNAQAAACSADEEEARDRLHMLRGGRSTAAGDVQVERSWKSFTTGLRRHTTADGGYCGGGEGGAGATDGSGGCFAPTASEKSFTAGAAFARFSSTSMRVRFVPEDEEEQEEEEDGKPRGRYGAYPGRGAGTGARRATTSNLVLPPSCESVIAMTDGPTPASPQPLITQPPPPLQAWTGSSSSRVSFSSSRVSFSSSRVSFSGAAAHACPAAADGAAGPALIPHPPPVAATRSQRARSFDTRCSGVLLSAAGPAERAHALPALQASALAPPPLHH
ncbi:hypothetical protein HXX76_000120 [Chlamydomonas incerta]|uniref:Uncharacterized protein n=1 Tax=Chlamydomonas incerta TaxID=51695 RepID=A0A835WDX8_CHLIN|nr:hypothetical protein HXX76_000120 [Chlamydomonas incerta]|eukprot:KAG2445504.1 hypothetical protein HXX76_000120 [Chlamydomonas incerta]